MTLKNLDNQSLIDAFMGCKAKLGKLPNTLYTNYDSKHFGSNLTSFLNLNSYKLCTTPSGLQNQNGLVKRVWHKLVKMARVYLIDMQCPKIF